MPLTINYAKVDKKVITMGKKEADYYPPGATEPIVRPDDVPAEVAPPAVPIAEVDEKKSLKEAATTPPVAKTVQAEKPVAKKK